jgi:DNA-binding transcriptional LysR family regulator
LIISISSGGKLRPVARRIPAPEVVCKRLEVVRWRRFDALLPPLQPMIGDRQCGSNRIDNGLIPDKHGSMFELAQLRCFVAVAEELHFGQAGVRLNMTQPPVSRQIQLLEHRLEVRLFDRTSRTVRLTPAGNRFLPEARRLLRLAEDATLIAQRTARGEFGAVTIGFTAVSGYHFLPMLLTALARLAPGIDPILMEMISADQLEALGAGRIDVGLVRPPFQRRDLHAQCAQREPLLLAVPDGHPLAEKATLSIQDLDAQPLIAYSPTESRYFHDLLAVIVREANILPRYVQYLSQIHSMLGLVDAGLGVALVPASAANLHFRNVVLRPIRIDPARLAEVHLVWRADNRNPAIAALRKVLAGLPGTDGAEAVAPGTRPAAG